MWVDTTENMGEFYGIHGWILRNMCVSSTDMWVNTTEKRGNDRDWATRRAIAPLLNGYFGGSVRLLGRSEAI